MEKDKDAATIDAAAITTTQQAAEPQTAKGVKILKIPKLELKKDKLAEKVFDDVEAAKKPSKLRQLLPIGLFLITFATVLSLLIIYLDTSGKFFFC